VPRLSLEGRLVEFVLVHQAHAKRSGPAVRVNFTTGACR
jgi:hypothetical protein